MYLNLPPKELLTCTQELTIARKDLCTVKSIQLEFVKHSKLSRRTIKLEKQIEDIKEAQKPKILKIKNALNTFKVIYIFIYFIFKHTNNNNNYYYYYIYFLVLGFKLI